MKLPKLKRPKPGSWFRWGYVAPRLAIVAMLVAALRFGLDPALKYALIAGGEAATGAKVDAGDLTTSLLDGRLTIANLAAANPAKPMKNLFEAAQINLEIDAGQLLRKRVVVHGGVISGVQFDSPRETSGELPEAPVVEDSGPSVFDPLMARAEDGATAWFDSLSGRLEEDLQSKLETPALVDQLRDRWPQQYAELQGRTDQLRARAKQVESTVREIKKNPLAGLEKLQPLQQELASINAELKSLAGQVNSLPNQAKADRAAIDAARKRDEEFLKSQVKLMKADGDQLTRYLLGPDAHDCIEKTASWISFARKLMPAKSAKIKQAERIRGVNIVFGPRQPKFLIERVALAGKASLGGEDLQVVGELTDAASEPYLHPNPMHLRLASEGAVVCTLDVVLDRRGDTPHDHLVLDCPRLGLPGRSMGAPEKLALNISPGEACIQADLTLDGENLTGTIYLRQSSAMVAAAPKIRDPHLTAAIEKSLTGVQGFEAKVAVAGTLKRPEWKIESELGRQLASGLDGALRGYLTEKKEKVMAKVQGKVDEQLAALDAKRQAAQQELLGKLGENQQLVSQIAALTGGGGNPLEAAVPKLGKSLSLDKFKR